MTAAASRAMQVSAVRAAFLMLLLLQANAEAGLQRWSLQQTEAATPLLALPNPNLRDAYVALHAWKAAIMSDPYGVTATWVGYDVCKYKGVFCAPPPDASCDLVVAGIDLNHANIAGTLPEKLGLLSYLALFHINTNRFFGTLPTAVVHWTLIYELDISNNLFSGPFPSVLLTLPSLAFLDMRFNGFDGELPLGLFMKPLDAIFVNNNKFSGSIPANLGGSRASVVVLARNRFTGEIPASLGTMGSTLNEIIFLGNSLKGCIPPTIGALAQLTVFDVSFNSLSGGLPGSIADMGSLQQLDVAHNLLSGAILSQACGLPRLKNLTASFNFFTAEDARCAALPSRGVAFDDSQNCISDRLLQCSPQRCKAFFRSKQLCPRPTLPAETPPPIYTYHGTPPPPIYTYLGTPPPVHYAHSFPSPPENPNPPPYPDFPPYP